MSLGPIVPKSAQNADGLMVPGILSYQPFLPVQNPSARTLIKFLSHGSNWALLHPNPGSSAGCHVRYTTNRLLTTTGQCPGSADFH